MKVSRRKDLRGYKYLEACGWMLNYVASEYRLELINFKHACQRRKEQT